MGTIGAKTTWKRFMRYSSNFKDIYQKVEYHLTNVDVNIDNLKKFKFMNIENEDDLLP